MPSTGHDSGRSSPGRTIFSTTSHAPSGSDARSRSSVRGRVAQAVDVVDAQAVDEPLAGEAQREPVDGVEHLGPLDPAWPTSVSTSKKRR